MTKLFVSRQVPQALNTRNFLDVFQIHNAPTEAPVLVYWREKNKWDGPYSVLGICGEDVTVLTPKGDAKFHNTVIKRYLTHASNTEDENGKSDSAAPILTEINESHSHWYAQKTNSRDSIFKTSHTVEFNRLSEQKRVQVSASFRCDRSSHIRVFFVDNFKNVKNPNEVKKFRLVVQAYNDSDNGLVTHAPNVQLVSQKLLPSPFATDPSLCFFTRDVLRAYVQAETSTQHQIYFQPSAELKLPPYFQLCVNRPLYSLPRYCLHWYRTYHKC